VIFVSRLTNVVCCVIQVKLLVESSWIIIHELNMFICCKVCASSWFLCACLELIHGLDCDFNSCEVPPNGESGFRNVNFHFLSFTLIRNYQAVHVVPEAIHLCSKYRVTWRIVRCISLAILSRLSQFPSPAVGQIDFSVLMCCLQPVNQFCFWANDNCQTVVTGV